MAKKIIIAFNDQPDTLEVGWDYSISINGFLITYSNTLTASTVLYMPYGYTITDPIELAIGVDLNETINKTLSYLQTYFVNGYISYSRVNNTIEVRIEADAVINVSEIVNPSLELTTEDIEPDSLNLKYYLIYGDYRLNIYKKNYLGTSSEIRGSMVLTKGSVDTILETIRGSGLNLSLEAKSGLTFDEFILEDEFTYKTELLKSNQIIFNGYIKPDGVQQSYVADEWLVNITSTDGLGALKDLSFVQTNGLPFKDKLSMYEVIKGCLDRTRLSMTINTCVDVFYLDYDGENTLKDTYINSERFIKDINDNVIMDCNEVLNSILNLFSAVVTQQDGQWWVYRPNDIGNGIVTFINNDTDQTFVKNISVELGSQIDNYYPHHCGGNQQIEVLGAISAYRLNYQYGFLDGFITNKNLNHDGFLNFDGWNAMPYFGQRVVNIPNDTSGLIMSPNYRLELPYINEVLKSNSITVLKGTILKLTIKVKAYAYQNSFLFKIKTSDGYYFGTFREGETFESGEWSTNPNTFVGILLGEFDNPQPSEGTLTVTLLPILNDCNIEIIILSPIFFYPNQQGLTEVNYIQITDDVIKKSGQVGEFHTVTRGTPPSSITKENQKVFNGDSRNIFIGAIYKSDKTTPTTQWTRKNRFETKPLLLISAEDDLRIQSAPVKLFSGDIFGQIPYLSVISINNVFGLFMFIEYSYDIKENILSGKMMQMYNNELGDILYNFSYDYGNNTIKPTIV
jgi:hypothetical protein